MKNIIFWKVTMFLKEPQGLISQKTAFFKQKTVPKVKGFENGEWTRLIPWIRIIEKLVFGLIPNPRCLTDSVQNHETEKAARVQQKALKTTTNK
jgi:hypothetical protein